jgi:actin-like ATPase involved in cell morphogenesis
MSNKVGIDLGTNLIVSASTNSEGSTIFKQERNCFYMIRPKTEVNRNSIKTSIDKRGLNYIIDTDGSFIIIGEPALEMAMERNDVAQRPMIKGIISPKEKASLPILKLIIENMIGKGEEGSKCVYSVPGKPIDGNFDIVYHSEIMGLYIRQMGYDAQPINEAFAIALSELLDNGLTGITLSFGAGLTNICVVHEGDPLVEFSVIRGGDFIDQSVASALDLSQSLIQVEKESGTDLYNPSTKIMEAVSVYYSSLLNYVFNNIAYELKQREKDLPLFREPVPIVVSGGLSLATGFVEKVESILKTVDFPIKISDVRKAADPMTSVAQGALLASSI